MLKSLFSSSLRGVFHFQAPHMIPMQAFANTFAKPKSPIKKKKHSSGRKESDFPNSDPKLANLKDYVFGIDTVTALKVFKNCDFEKDMLPALNVYRELKFNNEQLKYLFKRKPTWLRLAMRPDQTDVVKFTALLRQKWSMTNGDVKNCIMRNPRLMSLTSEEFLKKTESLKAKLQMTDGEIKRLLVYYPETFSLPEETIDKTIQLVKDYTDIPNRTLGIIAARFPYFLNTPYERLLGTFKVLHNREFTKEQIIGIMKRHAEAFTVGETMTAHSFNLAKKLKLGVQETARIYSENPRLLSISPTQIMPKKFKLLKSQLKSRGLRRLIRKYPRVLVKSLGSNALKVRYLRQRMKVRVLRHKLYFPAILNYSYANVIRPRGEMMLRNDKVLPWNKVLNLTDEEFVQKVGMTLDELNRIKAEFPERQNELDAEKRIFSHRYGNLGRKLKY